MIWYNYKVVVHFNNLKNTKFCIFFKAASPPCFWSGPPLLWTWQLNRPSTPPYILYYILLASDPKRWPGVFPYLLLHRRRSSTLAQRPSSSSRPRREQPQVADFSTDRWSSALLPAAHSPRYSPVRPHSSSLFSALQRPKELITSSTYLIFFSSSLSITTYVYTKAGAVRRSLSALALTYHAHKISLMRNWRMM